ncbi:GRIP and coiled-coil domain-containing protein 1 [Trichonephila inaurata madagascariensis]|uniref:GRIP and coiled-coil domain-containing protein 1 n=1 Tax=Trichonephila inaurata madagascariensis TaxID=2747483 RepID=A0A8X6JWJ6_9ARAC|nr:GRIP and coiled-coil domain-containing protein 1 [Trichonephila inaurata madagascariensis]
MEKKTKKELLLVIEEQNQNLLKYKSRLHDIVESYKNLIREKEALESSIKTLTEVSNATKEENEVDSIDCENQANEKVSELQQKYGNRVSERKVMEYEKTIEDLQNKLTVSQDRLRANEKDAKKNASLFQRFKEEMEELKLQYLTRIDEEKKRAELTEEKLKLFTFVKEKRITSLENKISELSTIVGEHDKVRQQDQLTIQKLKAKISQLQVEYSAIAQIPDTNSQIWEYTDVNTGIQYATNYKQARSQSESSYSGSKIGKDFGFEKSNAHYQAEMIRMKEELEQYKTKAELALKEKYNKTSAALLSDAKSGKEIKELKSRIAQLEDQLQTCKSQLKLNEEYHNKITANLEKSCEDLKVQHKQELAQAELSYRTQLLELEHQIQKQRERTLALLEEKDKEIELLKSSFLTSFIKKNKVSENDLVLENTSTASNQEAAANLLSNSLISSQKDGHILHYIQELARKDVEISNLRQSRIQTESSLRKLQQKLSVIEDNYSHEVDMLKSRIKLLESSQDEEGTNVEYLKNVILRFLKCNDSSSKRHMVNAISTVLHFTSSEIQEIKGYIR